MKNCILFFIFLFVIFLWLTELSKASCITGFVDSTCCDGLGEFDNYDDCGYCVENNNEAYCSRWFGEDPVIGPFKCEDEWSSKCCCNGTESLTCASMPNPEKKVWGDSDCGRTKTIVDCNGVANSHFICNDTYDPFPHLTKCVLVEPEIKSYTVSNKVIALDDLFSINVYGFCPNGFPGKCLVECSIKKPDNSFVEAVSWDDDGSVTLPSIKCESIGKYTVEQCGIYTDFNVNGGWGDINSSTFEVTCLNADVDPPTFSYDEPQSGSVNEGTIIEVSTLWNDNVELGLANFYHNETGSWIVNPLTLSGNQLWYNYSLDTTGYGDKIICWYETATDSIGNLNSDMPRHCLYINPSGGSETNLPQSNPDDFFQSLTRSMSKSSSDFTINLVSLAFQFFGIVLLTIILVILVQQILQSV